ncbi:MAG: 30S ribosomal protein S4e [Candidatus Asgardarchaeia archaeon]
MTRKHGSLKQKRISAPKIWPIHRKSYKFTIRALPGPHPKEASIPLLIILRDILGYANTKREAKRILSEGKVKVDGKIRRELGYPVGLMDVIELVPTNETYRVLPNKQGKLILHPIPKEEASFKLCSIYNKTTVRGGHIQLNLHDGRNIIIEVKDPRNPTEDVFKTFDTIKLAIPKQRILDHIPFKEGVLALVVSGKNMGDIGRITKITRTQSPHANVVELQTLNGEKIETTTSYVFPIGVEKPIISLPEMSQNE